MITYCATGQRDYRQRPVPIQRRQGWEFAATLHGCCAPTLERRAAALRTSTLWTFPPDLAHGWTSDSSGACTMVVIHSTLVPDALGRIGERLLRSGLPLATAIGDDDARMLLELQRGLDRDLRKPDGLSRLREERAVLDLALLALRDAPADWLPPVRPEPRAIVDRALAWCTMHLTEGASVTGAAHAAGVAPATLRRLCHQVLGRDLRAVLRDLRLRRADDLLADPARRLDDIAPACGFADAPSLSRAYKAVRGHPPRRRGG